MDRLMPCLISGRRIGVPRREPAERSIRRTNMATIRSLALLIALTAAAAACGSDSTGTSDSVPSPDTVVTQVPVTEIPRSMPGTEPPTPIPSTPAAPDPAIQAELDAARELWAAQGPDAYTIVTKSLCFCLEEQWSDTVIDGVVTEHVALTDDVFADPGARPMILLFDAVQSAIDDDYVTLDLSFDPETGALRQFFVDIDEMIADEEYGVEVISVEPLG